MRLIGMDFIREIVETAFITSRLKGLRRVSLLLIAPVGSGKTSVATQKTSKFVMELTDLTGVGIYKAIEKCPEIEFFIIDDLTSLSGKKSSVKKNAESILSALIEQGVRTVVSPSGVLDFTALPASKGKPVRKGLICGITDRMVSDGRGWWQKTGFSSRLLPLAFHHSYTLQEQIFNFCFECESDAFEKTGKFNLRTSTVFVERDKRFLPYMKLVVKNRYKHLAEDGPYRLAKMYEAMLRAHAVLRGELVVKDEDFSFIEKMDKFVAFSSSCYEVGDDKKKHLVVREI